MNLPLILKQLTGTLTLTGLYSFEFVDKKRNTITEIFFMIPPKKKDMTEVTRSTTNPTLSSNYITDAGNGVKNMTLSGELYFPYVGSPDNPVARDSSDLQNQIDGMTEFFKLRWMLMRYRDYTMTQNSKIDIPSSVMNSSPQITKLYQKISKLVKDKVGALYDEIQLIVHDYDMDDHYYCKVNTFSSSQSDSKYIAVEYTIILDCYEKDDRQTAQKVEIKKSLNESVNISNTLMQNTSFNNIFSDVYYQIKYISNIANLALKIKNDLDLINSENTLIQSSLKTPIDTLPSLLSSLINNTGLARYSILTTLLSKEQFVLYEAGDLTLDDILDLDSLFFYNSLQKLTIYSTALFGVLNSSSKKNIIRYGSNSDNYTLTTEQFDLDVGRILNETNFYFYTIQSGDTSKIIALRELNDPEKYVNILQLNSITESDLIEGNLIGTKIKIPIIATSSIRSENNLVYERDDSDINKFIHGSDILNGINQNLQISPTGDILSHSGIDVTYASLLNRLNIKKGTMGVSFANFGITDIGENNSPFMVRVDKYLSDLINQIQAEPRVESVDMDISSLRIEGEAIYISGIVNFIGEEKREVSI